MTSAQRSLEEEATKCAQLQQDRDAITHSAQSEVAAMRRAVHQARAHSSSPEPPLPPQTFDIDDDDPDGALWHATTTKTLSDLQQSLERKQVQAREAEEVAANHRLKAAGLPHHRRMTPVGRQRTEHLSKIANLRKEVRAEMMTQIRRATATMTNMTTTFPRECEGRIASSMPSWTPERYQS